MKKSLVLLSLSAIVALNSSADTFGFEAGAAFWGAKTSGDFEYRSSGNYIDLEKDLGYDDLNTNFILFGQLLNTQFL